MLFSHGLKGGEKIDKREKRKDEKRERTLELQHSQHIPCNLIPLYILLKIVVNSN